MNRSRPAALPLLLAALVIAAAGCTTTNATHPPSPTNSATPAGSATSAPPSSSTPAPASSSSNSPSAAPSAATTLGTSTSTGASPTPASIKTVTTGSSPTPSASTGGPTIPPGQAAKLGLKPLKMAVLIKHTGHHVQALTQLKIHGKAYYFIIDTGASTTVIDSTVATTENLAPLGTGGKATTLGCTVPAQPVAISNWSINNQPLPSSVLPAQKTDLAGHNINGIPLGGLLGADLFYLYGTMTLNFTNATLSLGQPAPAGTHSFPIRSQQTKTGGVTVLADLTIHRTHALVAVDTGASVTEIDATLAHTAGLTNTGKPTTIGAVSCTTTIQPITLDHATIGAIPLPTISAVAATNPAPTTTGRQGLLGADLLSTFGTVTFDFPHRKVILG